LDDGQISLKFINPSTLKTTTTDLFSKKATTTEFYNAVKGFYSANYGANIAVTRRLLTAGGIVSSDWTTITKAEYTITLLKSILSYTTNQIDIAKQTGATTTFAVAYPLATHILSSPPLTGKFQIQCV
jgi:hypothetical protein